MNRAVIVDAVRTPIGRYKGALKDIRPDDLGAAVIRALVERNPLISPREIEEVVMGNANQAGEDNRNVGRMSALLAGLPVSVGGTTINRLCGSGLDAVLYAVRSIACGEGDTYIAGGTESMTRAPLVTRKPETAFPRGNMELFDTTIGWRFINDKLQEAYGIESMPETAENVAKKYGITREEQDLFALSSQQKAKAAMEKDVFSREIIPVAHKDRKGNERVIDRDEHPRPESSLESLAKLPSLFAGGTVTAGNASGINDGASALLLMSEEKALQAGCRPLAYVLGGAIAGVEPSVMGIGPVESTKKLLERLGLNVNDIDRIELNEAFAAQSIACIEELKFDREKVNVNGGAIAFGHPLGASGARILTTLVHELSEKQLTYGLATMCVGVGQGISLLVKRYSS
ncbi:MAG: acetyl-CoA C-acyltransferase [Bacillus sp. (in: firmicutes)]